MRLGREAGKTETRSEKREVGSKKEGSRKQEAEQKRSKKQEAGSKNQQEIKKETRNKKQKIRQQPPFDPGWMFKRINLQIAGRFVHRPVTKAALKLPMT